MPRVRYCRNRNIVQADNRLYSPFYDWDGDDGLSWSSLEFIDADAMCFWGMCDHESYNAWARATGRYIEEQLVPHLREVKGRAMGVYQGAPLPQRLTDTFNKIENFVHEWDEANIRPNKDWKDTLWHPLAPYWWGEIRGIIKYFDDAACYFDDLDDIAQDDLKSPALAKGAPKRTIEASPTGSFLDGSGGARPGGGGQRSGLGMAVGIMAIGAAGYLGYKVLTE